MKLHDQDVESFEPNRQRSGTAERQPRPLIIERGYLQSRPQRWGYRSVTFICWMLWLYMFVPLLSLVAWLAGLTLIYEVLVQDLLMEDLQAILARYVPGLGILIITFFLWALSSYLRFRRTNRRRAVELVSKKELAESHHLEIAELEILRQADIHELQSEQLERMFGDPQ